MSIFLRLTIINQIQKIYFCKQCSPRDRTKWGSWVGAPLFGEKMEGDMDLPCQGTMSGETTNVAHHVLENRSNEQDTDFKGTFVLLNVPSEGLQIHRLFTPMPTTTQISPGCHQNQTVTSEELNEISMIWTNTVEIGLLQVQLFSRAT